MPIQIEQKFPRCQRCGRMIHLSASRIEAIATGGEHIVLCSEICRDEYKQLYSLADRGDWRMGSMTGQRRV